MTAAVSGARLEGALLAAALVLLAGCGRTGGADVAVTPFPPARVEATLTAPTPSVSATVLPVVTATAPVVTSTVVIEPTRGPSPTATVPPAPVRTPAPTPVGTPPPPVVADYDVANGKSITVHLGGILRVELDNGGGYSYWEFEPLPAAGPLIQTARGRFDRTPCIRSSTGTPCNRDVFIEYRAVAVGVADLRGSRRICGEVALCLEAERNFTLRVEVVP